ncbi:MAG: GNAT family N-acetyltransferase [Alphaproteobacteria bacterium]|nr:GNAT family N-acetyltransferase [Alphaproteobacteria bacterium]
MGMMSDTIRREIDSERMAYVASVNDDGTPNLSPKATLATVDDDHVAFCDLASPRTLANIAARPAVEANSVDPIRRKGWRLAGTARVVDGGAEFESLAALFRGRGANLDGAGRQPPVRRFVVIRVSKVSPLLSPAYAMGQTEPQVVDNWSDFWRARAHIAQAKAEPRSVRAPEGVVARDFSQEATPPRGITIAREEGRLGVQEFADVLRKSTIRRPLDDVGRLTEMLRHANLVLTARDGGGALIGVARSLTDFAYCCYLSDLAVDTACQGRGVGKALLYETKRIIGPQAMLLLLSAPDPMTYYPRIGMDSVTNGFIIRREF